MQGMSQPPAHRHHAIDYVELTVTDLEPARRFYSFTDPGGNELGVWAEA